MAVIITRNFVLVRPDDDVVYGITPDHPAIGWRSVVTRENVTATTSDPNFPPLNLANPATHLKWRGAATSADEIITVVPDDPETVLDYVAIAAHNLGSEEIPIGIGYNNSLGAYVELVAPVVLPNNSPAMFRFEKQKLANIKIKLTVGAAVPQIAVLYTGKLLKLPRKLYQGFAPINYGRVAKVTNGQSEAGQFLGRIVLQEFVRDTVPLSLISPTYFRDHIAAFLVDSKENPFFIAWRPQSYPYEIGYCHMTNDPVPVNEAPHGLVAMSLEMTGVI